MDLDEIKSIITLMKENDLTVFQLEREGFKIKLQRGAPVPAAAPATFTAEVGAAPAVTVVAAPAVPEIALREIPSPMVGTFYQAPSPDSAPFVKVGQEVNETTVVCIIEAMKVMNEIKAEMRGVIAEVVAENGKPVQFGQALFKVR